MGWRFMLVLRVNVFKFCMLVRRSEKAHTVSASTLLAHVDLCSTKLCTTWTVRCLKWPSIAGWRFLLYLSATDWVIPSKLRVWNSNGRIVRRMDLDALDSDSNV